MSSLRSRAARFLRAMLCVAVGAVATARAQDQPAAPVIEPAETRDFIRVLEEDGGNRVKLQTSSRHYKPTRGNGPEVSLVGAMHIGDHAYYSALQEHLERFDVVLYEGVKPSEVGQAAAAAPDDASRRAMTERRLRLLAILVEKQRRKTGSYPASLDAMIDSLARPLARMARGAAVDGWGQAVTLVEAGPAREGAEATTFDLVSLGADGQPGGEGAAADVRFSEQKPLSKAELNAGQDGIQVQMASALGLEFQLTALDYTRARWRNSDLSIDAVQRLLADSGQSGEALFRMLDGSSFPAKLAGLVLGLIKSSPQSQAMAKLMMIEMLSRADDLLSSGAGGMGKMMQVIVVDRNQAVFDDLMGIIEREPGVKSVAIFYGSGHIPDLEKRLVDGLGYRLEGEDWFTGIDLDMKATGMDPAQAGAMRAMIRRSIEQQMKTGTKRTGQGED